MTCDPPPLTGHSPTPSVGNFVIVVLYSKTKKKTCVKIIFFCKILWNDDFLIHFRLRRRLLLMLYSMFSLVFNYFSIPSQKLQRVELVGVTRITYANGNSFVVINTGCYHLSRLMYVHICSTSLKQYRVNPN